MGCAFVFDVKSRTSLIAYEGFQGTADVDLDGNGSGTGWADASWTDENGTASQFVYEDPGLVHKTLAVSGLSATYKGNGSGANTRYSRGLDTTITLDTDGETLWASYILDMQETFSGRGFGVELTNNGSPVVAFGKGVNSSSGLGTAFTSNWENVGNPTGVKLLMLELFYDLTADETTAMLLIDGSASAPLGSASATGSITIPGPVTIDGVNLYGYHTDTVDNTLDELRLGDTQGDVIPVPEPMSLALLGLGASVILLQRRRR